MTEPARARPYFERLDAVARRLRALASHPGPPGLTDPDRESGEQWEWNQVWAHLAEIIGYWIPEAEKVAANSSGTPVPFGRVKSDPKRVAAIEAGRRESTVVLMARLEDALARLRVFMTYLDDGQWDRRGLHSARGEMTLQDIMEHFVVGHLEEHAAQLDGLVKAAPAE